MSDIYDLTLKEKTTYETGVGVPVASNWEWSMYNHINYSLLMKNGQFPTTQTKWGERPSKNIILPILNVAYRSEGFDVKDIEVYVDNADFYHLSLLARKFHTKWAMENDIDTLIDEIVENYIDYGGVLVKNVNNKRPEVVPWQSIAFCDQTDILSGTIAIKHQYSVDQLKDMEEKGWYGDVIDRLIIDAKTEKENSQSQGQITRTPDKHIEVYEVHGTFPNSWLAKDGEENYEETLKGDEYSKQIHIISYIKGQSDTKIGVCLFKGKEKDTVFKFLSRDKIFGRALGRGGIEELFEPQIWTNFNMIHMTNMLKEASKVIYQTADAGFTTRNDTKNAKNGSVFVHDDNKPATPLNTQPINFNLFDRATQEWEQQARVTGSASDPALGLNPVSGTPLGTTQTVTAQGFGVHEWRRGKIATFIFEIYRDWVIDYLKNALNKGDEWLDELSIDEVEEIAKNISNKFYNDRLKDAIINLKEINPEAEELLRQTVKEEYMRGGKKKFLKTMKDEFNKLPLNLKVNVAGKQKDMGRWAEKMTNLFRQIIANPQGFVQVMNIQPAAKAFNEMLEASGMSPMDFAQIPTPEAEQPEQPTSTPVQQPTTAQTLTSNQA